MVALALVLAAGIGIGYLRGGSIRNLASVRLRWMPLVLAALAVQLAAELVPADLAWIAFGMVIASYAMIFVWAGVNWRPAGMTLIALGALLNFIVIAVNRGMPVSAVAAVRGGLAIPAGENVVARGKHFFDVAGEAKLRWLSDIIPLWSPPVASIGDLVLWAGLIVLIQHLVSGRGAPATTVTDRHGRKKSSHRERSGRFRRRIGIPPRSAKASTSRRNLSPIRRNSAGEGIGKPRCSVRNDTTWPPTWSRGT